MTAHSTVAGVEIRAESSGRQDEILTPTRSPSSPSCIAASTARGCELLARRMERQEASTPARLPDFLRRDQPIRDGDWNVAPIPADLLDRRVEITGPVDRKMIINALNSGAKVFMADFEDATSPDLGQHGRGPGQPEGPLGRHDRLHRPGHRQGLRARAPSPPC